MRARKIRPAQKLPVSVFELCVRQKAKFGLVKILTLTGYSSVIIFDDQLAIRIFKKMASIDVNEQVLSECIKNALNYLSSGDRDIVLKSEQRVAIDVLEVMYLQFRQPMIFTVFTLAKKKSYLSGHSNTSELDRSEIDLS